MIIVSSLMRLILKKPVNYGLIRSVNNRALIIRYCSTKQDQILLQPSVQNYLKNVSDKLDDYLPKFGASRREIIRKLVVMRNDVTSSIKDLDELMRGSSNDEAFKKSIEEEISSNKSTLLEIDSQLFDALLPEDYSEDCDEAVMEVIPGVGGQEAMLFARDLFDMYTKYSEFKGWNVTVAEYDKVEMGGLRKGILLIDGEDVWSRLQFESGVHRVQRIPETEKSGRIHTSTVAVAVLPQPKEIDVQINDKDLSIETFRASGAGGQHVNTTDSAVRIVHIPTKTTIECQTERSQIKNREIALRRLKAKLYEMQYESQASEIKSLRRSQVGGRSRSEKVRTYNFNQDRITDHRISMSFHNLSGFLSGSKQFDEALEHLVNYHHSQKIKEFLENLEMKS